MPPLPAFLSGRLRVFSLIGPFGLVGIAGAQTIGLNFTDNDTAASVMLSSDTAGAAPVAAANWNNLTVNGKTGTDSSLVYADGSPVSGAAVSWSTDLAQWRLGHGATSGDDRMWKGYLDVQNSATVTVSGLSFPGSYDVYVYFDGSNSSQWRVGNYAIGGVSDGGEDSEDTSWGSGQNTTKTYQLPVPGAGGNQTFPSSPNNDEGNYVVLAGISGAAFTLTATGGPSAGVARAPINGIQIVGATVIPGLPQVATLAPADVTATSATLRGDLLDNGAGADVANVSFFWGTTGGGTAPGSWPENLGAGSRTSPGGFSAALSGLDPNTAYVCRAYAENSAGDAWASASVTFATPAALPTVSNAPATAILGTTAVVGATVTSTGGDPPALVVYYGTTDAGTSNDWENQLSLGTQSGTADGSLAGLAPDKTYYFRAAATNAAGTAWAGSTGSFATLAVSPPVVVHSAATDVGGISATLNGSVSDTGNDPPFVTFYYGTTDGGDVPAAWDAFVAVGNRSGGFSRAVSGLSPVTDYYFRAFAQNAAGAAWAAPSLSFSTTEYVPPSVVISEIHYDESDPTVRAEFIELFNNAAEAIDLTDWEFTSGIGYRFPPGATLAVGGYLVVAEDPAVLLSKFGHAGALGPWTGKLRSSGETVTLRDSAGSVVDTVDYRLGFPWPTVGDPVGSPQASPSIQLIHPLLDVDLGGSWRSAAPTPGAQNAVFSVTAPPQIRQVSHAPEQPVSAQNVVVSAKITDPEGVGAVTLSYQLVDPGDYIKISDARYAADWTPLPMNDAGTDGDALAGDNVFSVTLPASLQTHRRLVRYQIAAADTDGTSVTVPYADDPQPNFAYFVYDGIPAYVAKATPSDGSVAYDFGALPALQQNVAVYHLLTTREEHVESQHIPNATSGGYTGSDYLWKGSLVYDGRVYDHIRFRARGGVWRYAMGKNMWKFDFNRGHRFRARDDYGRRYATDWNKLNFSALIQQGNFGQRGEQGLFEAAGFRLHNLAGNPAPKTHFVHFRIVEGADEQGAPGNQFDTDFRGLYLAIEQMDGRFLEEHALPDGNLYKMENGTGPGNGSLNSQSASLPSDNSDLVAFASAYDSGTPSQAYWEQNLYLDDYYSFYAVVTAIHDNDIHAGKNFFLFHRPVDPLDPHGDKWQMLNWDLDLTWTNTYRLNEAPDDEIDQDVFAHADLRRDYRNRMREIRDLLFNADQTGRLLDEVAQFVHTPGQPSYVDADRAMWDYNPILTSSYANASKFARFYAGVSPSTFAGMLQHVKNYVATRSAYIDSSILTDDAEVPDKPTVAYTGSPGYPANTIAAVSSDFGSPVGAAFAAMEWRLGSVTDTGAPDFDPATPRKYEIDAVWESGEITAFEAGIAVPTAFVRPGETYRLRVRHKDASGRWGHWSDPIEFTAAVPDVAPYQQALVVSEIMFNPPAPSGAEIAVSAENDDYEFIELKNVSSGPVDLTGIRFTKGIDFDFPDGTLLAAGAHLLVVKNVAAFEARYGSGLPVIGSYGADNLANGGEQIKLSLGAGTAVLDFAYGDSAPWPAAADGAGYGLVLIRPADRPDHGLPSNWRISVNVNGSPGSDDAVDYAAWAAASDVAGSATDDDDKDGIANILEFALASHPGVPSPGALPRVSLTDGFLTIAYTRPIGADSVTYVVEFSADLVDWSSVGGVPVSSQPVGDGTSAEVWRYAGAQASDLHRFVRLKVLW